MTLTRFDVCDKIGIVTGGWKLFYKDKPNTQPHSFVALRPSYAFQLPVTGTLARRVA